MNKGSFLRAFHSNSKGWNESFSVEDLWKIFVQQFCSSCLHLKKCRPTVYVYFLSSASHIANHVLTAWISLKGLLKCLMHHKDLHIFCNLMFLALKVLHCNFVLSRKTYSWYSFPPKLCCKISVDKYTFVVRIQTLAIIPYETEAYIRIYKHSNSVIANTFRLKMES